MRKFILIIIFFYCGLAYPNHSERIQDSLTTPVKELKYDDRQDLEAPIFSPRTIENLKEDRAFDYTEKPAEENWWQQFKTWLWNLWLKFWRWLVGDYQANGIIAFLVHVLPYLIISGIVIFLVWLFYKLNPGATFFSSSKKSEVFFSEEEEIIKSKNINELIEGALADKNYRLAVRYYYLLILRKLSENEIISYEFDKTNSDYIAEISTSNIKEQFRKATNLYDYVWYGNFDVTETDFQKAQRILTSLENHLPKTHE